MFAESKSHGRWQEYSLASRRLLLVVNSHERADCSLTRGVDTEGGSAQQRGHSRRLAYYPSRGNCFQIPVDWEIDRELVKELVRARLAELD